MKSATIKNSGENISTGKIICIGQNYAEHAKEIKFEIPTSPIFFLKPASAIIYTGQQVVLPSISNSVHHEVELIVLIGEGGKNIPTDEALKHIAGYGVGLDMTMRDIQLEAKKKGLPWTLAKGFDTAAPISEFEAAEVNTDPSSFNIQLKVNGTVRQSSAVSKMIFPVQKLISYISQYITFERGDIIFTGTPEGVSDVKHGDRLEAELTDKSGRIMASLSIGVK
jgi:2-keto-4-pentenoate hydratase/2-oxohepta-3-ene-1,7-dioic acid hydratase in catechol pathway